MRVYISGSISNGDSENEARRELARIRFFEEEQRLHDAGIDDTVNPFRVAPNGEGKTWADYMKADIAALMTCDAIYMIPGWEKSRGAGIEYYIAMKLNYTLVTLP